MGKTTSMFLFAQGITSLDSLFSSAVPSGSPGAPHQGTQGWNLSAPFGQSTAPPRGHREGGSRRKWNVTWKRTGRDGGRDWGRGGTKTGSEFRPLDSAASLTRSGTSWEKLLCHELDSGCFLQKMLCHKQDLLYTLQGPVQNKDTEPLVQKLSRQRQQNIKLSWGWRWLEGTPNSGSHATQPWSHLWP